MLCINIQKIIREAFHKTRWLIVNFNNSNVTVALKNHVRFGILYLLKRKFKCFLTEFQAFQRFQKSHNICVNLTLDEEGIIYVLNKVVRNFVSILGSIIMFKDRLNMKTKKMRTQKLLALKKT